jgi:hypothetical protein
MKLLERLDRIVRPIAIPNLTMVLIAGQGLVFLGTAGDPAMRERLKLVWDNVLEGEVWRLLSFLFVPVTDSPIFLLFALYIFYIFGSSLDRHWGFVRYNTFLFLGTLLTIAAAAVTHNQPVTGGFLGGTVFLAFATYNPNYELRLMFVLPVKVKWLAWLQVAGYTMAFISGPGAVRLMVLASIGNYLIFFAPTVVERVYHWRRRMDWNSRQFKPGNEPRHECAICGVNSNTHPDMDFRYCSKCDGQFAYCEDHLRDHEHKVEIEASSK